jgi:hypothetical protein
MTKPIPESMTDGLNDLLGFQLAEWRSGYAVLEVELEAQKVIQSVGHTFGYGFGHCGLSIHMCCGLLS